jgi:pimeloyl-ACP methyl ester carboxylesterase
MRDVSVVLVHGAWADGSSWAKVIGPLAARGIRVLAASLPLTSLADDTAALERTLERVSVPVVVAAHAYAGAVIAATRNEKVKALGYVAALAPDEVRRSPMCSIVLSLTRWLKDWHRTVTG